MPDTGRWAFRANRTVAAAPQEGRVVATTEAGEARWSNGSPSGVSAEWGHKEWPKVQWAMTDIDTARIILIRHMISCFVHEPPLRFLMTVCLYLTPTKFWHRLWGRAFGPTRQLPCGHAAVSLAT